MKWKIQISGPKELLLELSEILTDEDFRLVHIDGDFFIESIAFDQISTPDEMIKMVGNNLDLLTNSVHLIRGIAEPIKVGGIARRKDDGSKVISPLALKDHIPLSNNLKIKVSWAKGKVINKEGKDVTPHPANDIKRMFDTARSYDEIYKAVFLLATRPMDWNSLYKLLDLIADDVGGFKEIKSRGWASKNSLERIHHTSVSYEEAGIDSRKLTQKQKPPSKPISLKQARSIMLSMFHNWWREKS